MAADKGPVALSLSLGSNRVKLEERVVVLVTFSNISEVPRYLHRDLLSTLEFSVRGSDGTVVRGFNDPPIPPEPAGSTDLIWLDKGSSVRLVMRLPLKYLGIRQPDVYKIVGFWSGIAATESQVDSKEWNPLFLYSEPVEISVPNKAVPLANPPLQPTGHSPAGG
jgi:hypothetical protein